MEKIAVVGLSCLFPGAQDPAQFWQNLITEQDSTSSLTKEHLNVDPEIFYDPERKQEDTFYCTRGGLIKNFHFDANGYNLPTEFLESLDDIFKWSLYVAKQALADSTYLENDAVLSKCGIILGNLSVPTKSSQCLVSPIYRDVVNASLQQLLRCPDFQLKGLPSPEGMSLLNMLTAGYPATVVAQALSLGGIHFTIDAACSSALYTVKLACHYLMARKADFMLAGAISCADPFVNHTGFSLLNAYPDDGVTRPLDRISSGLVTAEGAGMLALKRHSDAVRDGDKIYATILGVGLSNDGRGRHFVSPNPKGQILAFERTYAEAGLSPHSIDYVECHATGTDLGDRTELNSMDAFFGQYGTAPLVGSVKSNLGHLLTAAGMPSLLKVILGMSQGLIPPTINLQEPLCSINNVITADQIVKSTIPWRSKAPVKRAAVSAFGFGGTNAHLVMEQGSRELTEPVSPVEPVTSPTLPVLAIVGMDASFGSCDGLNAFDRTIYEGKQHFGPVPPQRWKGIESHTELLQKYGFVDAQTHIGAYIERFELDFLQFKIPPKIEDQPIPQQSLILKVADRALRDAGIEPGKNVAVIIAMGTDLTSHQYRARCDASWQIAEGLAEANISLSPETVAELEAIVKGSLHTSLEVNRSISYIGNIMACRISSTWDFSGPAFTLSAEENSVFKALEVAQLLLKQQEVDAVVVGAVDLAGGVEHVLLRNQITTLNTGTPTLGYDRNSNGLIIGEGAGAVVLKRLDHAKKAHDRIYATIDAISLVQDNYAPEKAKHFPHPPQASAVVKACQQAFVVAGIKPEDIGYLEVFGSGIAQEDTAEIEGLVQSYKHDKSDKSDKNDKNDKSDKADLSCAIGSIKANIGHTFAASGIASLIKAALCLYHRYIPATPQWSGPKQLDVWQDSPFYVASTSTLWSLDEKTPKRVAAINGLGLDGTHSHLILSEDHEQKIRPSKYLEQSPFYLFPLAASSRELLLQQLRELQYTVDECASLANAASQFFDAFQKRSPTDYVVAILGHDKDELTREIQRALKGLPKAFDQQGEWSTPLGSYFTAKPLGSHGIAFVYPGAFTSFLGQGKDGYHLFPKSFECIDKFSSTTALRKVLHETSKLIYPRSLTKLSTRHLEALETELLEDVESMLVSGTIAAILSTMIMRSYFQVQPKSAFGYSLGEVSMMFALNVWNEADHIISRIESSPLFKTRLAGPKNAVREYWGLPLQVEQSTDDFWSTYVVIAPVPDVVEASTQEDKVYITHINTPTEVVIAGDKQSCLRVIEKLNCDSIAAPISDVLHCEPMRSEYQELVNWLTLPVDNQDHIDFYSAANYARSLSGPQTIAQDIAKTLCEPLDFPRLVRQVYADGTRIFMEMGAGGTCSRWIRDILKHDDHLVLPGLVRGVDDHTRVLRALAKLTSHRVDVDLSPLYSTIETGLKPQKTLTGIVTVGGSCIHSQILTEENQKRFASYATTAKENAIGERRTQHQETMLEPTGVPAMAGAVKAIAHSAAPQSANKPRLTQVNNGGKQYEFYLPDVSLPSNAHAQSDLSSEPPATPPISDVQASAQPSEMTSFEIPDYSEHYRKLNQALVQKAKTHAAFLRSRQESLTQMGQLIQIQMTVSQQLLEAGIQQSVVAPSNLVAEKSVLEQSAVHQNSSESNLIPPNIVFYQKPASYRKPDNIIFDEAEVKELASGKISNVFGKEYEAIDSYPRCTRIPMDPYLFISRVTKLEAKRGCFEPCMIETEYDIPHDPWYAPTGPVPSAISIEASHGNILLASYLGADFDFEGRRFYRALGGKTTFVSDLPRPGETIRCEIKINSFTRAADTLLFFFTHDCYVGDRLVLKMDSGAGFFSEEDLKRGQGITLTEREKQERSKIQKQEFTPLLKCDKSSFSDAEIFQLSQGNLAACFGDHYDQRGRNPALRLPNSAIRMVDRVISVDPTGGAWGLGLIVGEKTLKPEDWYFNCHFKDDYCMPGTLISEGCVQMLQFYSLYLGLQTQMVDAVFQAVPHITQVGRYRGQIKPTSSTLTYRLEVSEICLGAKPYIKADAYIIFEGKTISITKNMDVQLSEQNS